MKNKILIIGGFGFIGKNLFHALKSRNYKVDILSNVELSDSDIFKNSIDKKNIIIGDILDQNFLERIIPKYTIIYALAGISGAKESNENPIINNRINCTGHLNILEACRKHNPDVLIIFPSSRLVYGVPDYLPVDEQHQLVPDSIYAIHKITAEHYYLLYNKLYNIKSIILRISNPYGPYQDDNGHQYGLLNWFILRTLKNESITLYGGGKQERDFIFIDDITALFITLQNRTDLAGQIFNVGSGTGVSILEGVLTIKNFLPQLEYSSIE